MTKLRDMPLSTPWPGPEGGTLGTVSQNAPYGTGGPALRNVSLETLWPPVYSAPIAVSKIPFQVIKYGGATGDLQGETHMDLLSFFDISPFKFEDGGTMVNTIRTASPNARILMYKAMAEMNPGSNTTAGIRDNDSCVNQAEAIAHDNANPADPWILKTAGTTTPLPSPWGAAGAYVGDVGSASFQQAWLANARAALAFFGLVKGKDGIFVDDVIAYNPGSSNKYTSDAAWHAAVLQFASVVFAALKADGYYVLCNALDVNTDDQLTTTKAWWKQLAPYVSGCLQEGWMSTSADRNRLRGDVAGWQDNYRQWVDIIDQMQSVGGDAHVVQINTTMSGTRPAMVYGLAAFLMEWNGAGGSYNFWVQGVNDYDASYRFDVGQPLAAKTEVVTSVFRRYYAKCTAIINTHPTNSYTVTSSPDGRPYTDPVSGAAISFPITIGPRAAVVWQTTSTGSSGSAAQKSTAFSDNFNDNSLDPQWTPYNTGAGSTITESSQQINDTIAANSKIYAGLRLLASDLTGSSAFLKVAPGTLTTVNQEVNFGVNKLNDSSNEYQFTVGHNGTNMTLAAEKAVNSVWTVIGVPLTYDAVNHAWLRIRESAGTIFFDTSPDGSTWTNRFSTAADWSPVNVNVYMEAGQKNITTPAITAVFDGFNTTTSGALTYSAEILAEANLQHYFRLGEAAGAGTAADSKGTNVLTARAGVTQGATGLITADTDKAVSLNGSATGYLDLTTGANFGPTSGDWAVEMWINIAGQGATAPNDFAALFGRDATHRLLAENVGGGPRQLLSQFGGVSLFSPSAVALGARHHVVLEYDSVANLLTMYVDGASVATATPTSTPTLAGTYAVGAYDLAGGTPGSGYMFNGVIDELAVYSGKLGATKVSSHYTNGTT